MEDPKGGADICGPYGGLQGEVAIGGPYGWPLMIYGGPPKGKRPLLDLMEDPKGRRPFVDLMEDPLFYMEDPKWR